MGAVNKNSSKNPRSPVSRIRPFPQFHRISIYYLAFLLPPLLILLSLTKENIHPPPPPPSSSSPPLFSYLLTPELEIMRFHVLSLLGIGGALINVAYSAAIALAPRQTDSPEPIAPTTIPDFVDLLSLDNTTATEVAAKLNDSAVALNLTGAPPSKAKLRKRTADLATELACWIIQLKFAGDSCKDGSTSYTTLSTLNWFVSSLPHTPGKCFR